MYIKNRKNYGRIQTKTAYVSSEIEWLEPKQELDDAYIDVLRHSISDSTVRV